MLEAKEGRIARWASRLSEYQMTIKHKRGKSLEHVDYFTRFIDMDDDDDVESRMCYTVNVLRATTDNLPTLPEIIQVQHPMDFNNIKGFIKKDGVIYYHSAILVPPSLRNKVISACHSVVPYRHHGMKKTSKIIRRVFNWPGLYKDIYEYLQSCLDCQLTKPGTERLQRLMRVHPIGGPFETVYIDFYKFTYNNVQRLVFTMIDHFTKWVECVYIHSSSTHTVSSAFVCNWVCRFGIPDVIMNDNDCSLIGTVMTTLHATFGTKALKITPYHPEGHATIESFHRTLNKGLSSIMLNGFSLLDFNEALQLVLYSYRSTLHLTTNESPAFLTYGMDLRPPADGD